MTLPEADAATRAWFLNWLETFSAHVRAVDYASARPLFHPEILAFGTHQDVLRSLEAWVETQWDNVWPRTDDFRFTIAEVHVLVSDDKSLAVYRSVDEHRLRPGRSGVRSPRTRNNRVS